MPVFINHFILFLIALILKYVQAVQIADFLGVF